MLLKSDLDIQQATPDKDESVFHRQTVILTAKVKGFIVQVL